MPGCTGVVLGIGATLTTRVEEAVVGPRDDSKRRDVTTFDFDCHFSHASSNFNEKIGRKGVDVVVVS